MKTTPGPWTSEMNSVFSEDASIGEPVCARGVSLFKVCDCERISDAQLISAAPEVLAEAEADLSMMIELQSTHLSHCAAVTRALLQKRIEATQAAIAKAQGTNQ